MIKTKLLLTSVLVGMLLATTGCGNTTQVETPKPVEVVGGNNTDTNAPAQGITVNKVDYTEYESSDIKPSILTQAEFANGQRGFTIVKDEGLYVFISLGEKSSAGHGAEVQSIEDIEGLTKITIEETFPKEGEMSAQVISYPVKIVKIEGGTPNIKVVTTKGEDLVELKAGQAPSSAKVKGDELQVFNEAIYTGRVDNNSIEVKVNGEPKVLMSYELDSILKRSQIKDGDKIRVHYLMHDDMSLEVKDINLLK